jgi:hypothetical protein
VRVTFVKTTGQKDRVYVARDDGSEVSWAFASYGDGLPHDMVHLLVERAFGVDRGFWGRVAAGIDPARVNAAADKIVGKIADKYAAFGSDLDELMLAESLANTAWTSPDVDPVDAIASAYAAVRRTPPPDAEAIAERLAIELEDHRASWVVLGDRGALILDWPTRRA